MLSKQDKANLVFKILLHRSKSKEVYSSISSMKNPLSMLSIKNYDLICKNEEFKKIMALALQIEVSKLTEYCKDIITFSNYIDSLAKTKKEKVNAKLSPINELSPELLSGMSAKAITFLDLPDKALKVIKEKYITLLKYTLVSWLPSNKLSNDFVSANPNAIDFFSLEQNRTFISWYVLSENPNAIDFLSLPENKNFIKYNYLSCNKSSNPKLIELLKAELKANPNIRRQKNWEELSKNPYAIEILTSPENYDYIKWKSLSSNTSPAAIKFLLEDKNIDFIKWLEFSRNPCDDAIQFLIDNPDYIDWEGLSANTNSKAIPLIKKKIKEENMLYKLSPTKYAELQNKVYWRALSANPKAIPFIIKKIKDGIRLDDIDWNALSENPAIFFPFKKNVNAKSKMIASILSKARSKTGIANLPDDIHDKIVGDLVTISINKLRDGIPVEKLNWSGLCQNPNAIDLIRDRMDFEKNLSKEEYDRLPYKINWSALCMNSDPGAIELLSLPENYDNIDWLLLSSNPNAIQLLEERVKYQLGLNGQQLNDLSIHKRINWQKLSSNPAIFVLNKNPSI
jgi:hypothetical protein